MEATNLMLLMLLSKLFVVLKEGTYGSLPNPPCREPTVPLRPLPVGNLRFPYDPSLHDVTSDVNS